MARLSKAEIEQRERERQHDIQESAKAMVQDMMPAIIAGLTTKLADARAAAGTEVAAESESARSDRSLVEALGVSIVKAADPKNRHQVVDPALLASRRNAHQEMVDLLIKFRAEGVMPRYKLKAKSFLGNIKIDPQFQHPGTKAIMTQMVDYPKPPNAAMEPVNESAKLVYAAYRRSHATLAGDERQLPKLPWLGKAPWIFGKEGIVKGNTVEEAPERIADPNAIFPDMRVFGSSEVPKKEVRVLGTEAPPVVINEGMPK